MRLLHELVCLKISVVFLLSILYRICVLCSLLSNACLLRTAYFFESRSMCKAAVYIYIENIPYIG
jgi:hypothetical protein